MRRGRSAFNRFRGIFDLGSGRFLGVSQNIARKKLRLLCEYLGTVNYGDDIGRNVGCVWLEPSMNVNFVVEDPASMSEALHRAELEPLRTFCVLDLHCHCFANCIGATSNDDHRRAHEEGGLLLTRNTRTLR